MGVDLLTKCIHLENEARENLYGGTVRLFDNISEKNGIEVTKIDCTGENVKKNIKDNTKAIYIETPTNPMMNVIDIEELSSIAKKKGIWLILRGIKTIGIRMEKAQENAFEIVHWLEKQKEVKRVIYPGLPTHPGYETMKKQSRGFGTMVTFEVANEDFAKAILQNVRLIQFAESLGGVETMITYPITQTHADVPKDLLEENGINEKVLRLSVGIEAAKDLLSEFERVFEEIRKELSGN